MRVALAVAAGFLLLAPASAQGFPEGAASPFGHDVVRIRLDPANLTADDAAFADEARAAMHFWEQGGNGRLAWNVTFVEVANVSDADVNLWFRDAGVVGPLCEEAPSALGCATPVERPVSIEILARRSDATFVPYKQVREVTEHELGHALGFSHSVIPGDIMAPHASRAAQTSWRPGDLARLIGGGALLLALIGGLVWLGARELRPDARIGRVRLLTESEIDGPCPVDRRGHRFEDAEIDVGGTLEWWRVCVHCGGGAPR